jgi:OOP family OmpA-OmpF porin
MVLFYSLLLVINLMVMAVAIFIISRKTKGEWTEPKGIGKPINSNNWEAQPSFSSDAKTLYFASNRPGGFGGRDIWVSYLDENMKLGEP